MCMIETWPYIASDKDLDSMPLACHSNGFEEAFYPHTWLLRIQEKYSGVNLPTELTSIAGKLTCSTGYSARHS